MQSVHTDTKGNAGLFRGVSQGIVAMVRSEGVLSLWRGLAPTLWRDVPFSAIYWMGYENIKKRLVAWDSVRQDPVLNEFEVAFASGAISGMVSASSLHSPPPPFFSGVLFVCVYVERRKKSKILTKICF